MPWIWCAIFSFDAHNHVATIENWVTRMPKQSGFAQSEFESHVREEYSTYDWIIEVMLKCAGFTIAEKYIHAPEYANFVCRRD